MSVSCPHCQNSVDAAPSAAGDVLCSSCGAGFRVDRGTTEDWNPAEHQRTLGKFELLDLVGAGGFGSVYKALDKELGRIVAVKVPRAGNLGSSGDSDRFLREARSVAQLRHPSIVPVFEIGQDSGLPYLVSEFVHGITLADLLTSERLPPRDAAELVANIAEALHYAHQQGVVHRDVKPSNIMLETRGEGEGARGEPSSTVTPRPSSLSSRPSSLAPRPSSLVPRLMDFGLAKRDAGEITMTLDGQVIGTPAYMSPEQARGESHAVDGRSDVYSLGVIFYQLLTGELPFKGNARMLMHHVLHDEPKLPRSREPKTPKDLETICLKAMAKEPVRRYPTAGELAIDLRRFLKGEPIKARPVGRAERAWRWCRRNPAVAGLGASVVLLLGGLLGVTARNWQSHGETPTPRAVANNPEPDTSADELLKFVAELDRTDPGWRFEDIEARRKVIPDDQNGALQIVAFRKIVADMTGRATSQGTWLRRELTERVSALEQLLPTTPLTDADVRDFRAELKRVEPALTQARKMIAYPHGRFTLAYKRDYVSVLLPDHQAAREVARLLELDALLQMHDGNRRGAVDDCRAMLNICGCFTDEPIAIGQIIRTAIFWLAVRNVERLIAHAECTDAELKAFGKVMEEATAVPVLLIMARGERGMLHYFLGSLETGDVSPATLEMFGIKDRGTLPSASDLRRFHVWLLRYDTQCVDNARQPPEQWDRLMALLEGERKSEPLAGTPIVETLQGLLTTPKSLAASATRHLAITRSAMTAIAVERYRLAHGDWPRNLTALVPTYLKEVPNDPYDGQPLRYRRTGVGVVVYCLGPDRTDNRGNLHRTGDVKDGTDIGFQLWDVAKRRRPAGGG